MKALLAASTLATTVAIACGTVKVDRFTRDGRERSWVRMH